MSLPKTLRRSISLFLVLLMTVSLICLCGCHGSRDRVSFETPSAFDTSRNYELTFWAKNDTNKAQTLIYQKAIDDFQALYPNITINMRLYTDYGKIYNDVITNISTDTTPNICVTYPDHIATYLTGSDVVVPLDDLLNDAKYGLGGSELLFDSPRSDEIVPQFLQECTLNGHCYALPYMRSTEACYVNKTYVEKLGFTLPETLTWDFVWEVCSAAMEKNPDGTFKLNGQNVMIPFIYKSTDNMMIQMLRQLNAGYSTDAGEIQLFNDTTKQLLYEISSHVKNGEFSTFKISSYPANFLNAGQCIFAVDSTAGSTWIGTDAPLLDIAPENVVEFETEVMTIPQFDPEHPSMISQGPSVCIFNKSDPQEVLASWMFMQFLLTNDTQIAYSETEGYIPVTLKAQNSDEYQDYLSREGEDNSTHYEIKIKSAKLLIDNTENTFTTPVFNGSTSLRNAAGALIESVTKSTRRKQTVDETYMENLFADTISLYRLDQYQGGENGNAKRDLGPLPQTAVILLASIAVCWVGIAAYCIVKQIRTRMDKNRVHKSNQIPHG